jgi:predicted acylesterase/phospholipase RssA
LIAPFAFLGPDCDNALKTVYTSITPKDIYTRRSLLAAITNDAMADTRPLWNLIKKYITRDMLLKIAKEYGKGRLLFIGTTNLDSRRPVIWNMGAIAASNDPGAPDLFCSILLASAAIPGAFPPVMINVETDGQQHQEMHVDGGAVTQVFLYPPRLIDFARNRGLEIAKRERKVYIIRNARLDPDWASVERRTLNIAGRAISSLIHSQGIGDLYRIYLQAQKDGLDYNLAYIPDDFYAPRTEDFDREYMNKLFEIGYQLGRAGYKWHKYPPYLKPQSKP